MGAWGEGAFANDDAMDWIGDLTSANGRAALAATLATVADAPHDKYIEIPEASTAIAAAEVVAAAGGKPGKYLPDEILGWIEEEGFVPTADVIALARRAVANARENSELRGVWDDAGAASWLEDVSDLERRLLSL